MGGAGLNKGAGWSPGGVSSQSAVRDWASAEPQVRGRAALGVCISASEEKFWQADLRAASVSSSSSSAFSLCGVFSQRVRGCTILGSVLRLYGPNPPAQSPPAWTNWTLHRFNDFICQRAPCDLRTSVLNLLFSRLPIFFNIILF